MDIYTKLCNEHIFTTEHKSVALETGDKMKSKGDSVPENSHGRRSITHMSPL